jgi:2-octaprenyl-6-methoxyphenol hydroxylase
VQKLLATHERQEIVMDVCVVGAGPVGGTLACRLAGAGLKVAVVDRAALPPMEHPGFDGRAYAIAAGSRGLLEDAGIWAALPAPAGPIEQIHVSDGKPGRPASPLFLHFDHKELPASQDPHAAEDGQPFGWMVEARNMRVALNAVLHASPNVTLFAPAQAAITRTADGAAVQLDTGASFSARLVIAAEGRDSPLRRQAGITAARWPYRQSGIVCAIAHEHPHHRIALEHFLPAGPFAQLPMAPSEAGDNISAIVWSERADVAPRLMAMDDAAFGAEIAIRLGDHLGAIRPVGRRWIYPLSAMYVHRVTAERLAIAGDAAHGIHPIAGQGLNLGLRDAIALSALIIEAHQAGQDIGAADLLARYQRARRVDNVSMLLATDGLERLFSNDNPLIRAARDLGIAAVHRMPPLKRAFMRQAMGLR